MANSDIPMKMAERELVPRFLVRAMFGLMLFALALVGYAQWADVPRTGVLDEAPIVAERQVTLSGTREGAVTVIGAEGAVLAHSTDDLNGFIGVIWRVFDRHRHVKGADADAPVRVVRRQNGNIAVIDTATELSVELIGYGSDNVAAFARLVD